jgi:hypothetical protein
MDLMKKTEKIWKITSVVIFFLILTACFNENSNTSIFEELIINTCKKVDEDYKIELKNLTKFSYDKLYIFEGPRFPSEIEQVTNIKYDELLDDGVRLYLFVKNNNIIKQEKSLSKDVNIHRIMNEQGFCILSSETILYAKQKKNGDDNYYDTFYK